MSTRDGFGADYGDTHEGSGDFGDGPAPQTSTPRGSQRSFGFGFGKSSRAVDEDAKGQDGDTPGSQRSKPARMRRFTQAAMPEVWARANQAQSQMHNDFGGRRTMQNDLRARIEEMNNSVRMADENLRNVKAGGAPADEFGGGFGGGFGGMGSGYNPGASGMNGEGEFGGGGFDDGGFYGGSGFEGDGFYDTPPEPKIDPMQLQISHGPLAYKLVSSRFGITQKKWATYHCRLDRQHLKLFVTADDERPRCEIYLDRDCIIRKGDKDKQHKNKAVNDKYTFDIVDGHGKTHNLYAEEETDATKWINTIEYIIGQCKVAQHEPAAGGLAAKPKLAPEEEEAARDEALRHHAHGVGLFQATRGETTRFTIQAYDEYDNPKTHGGDPFKVCFENDELHFDLKARDNGDGTYLVAYCPTRVGDFELSITLNDFDIFGSPYTPVVHAAPTSGAHCVVYGGGIEVADAGKVNEFTIVARDQFDGERGVGGDNFIVEISGPAEAQPVVDHGDGKYSVSYSLNVSPEMLAFSGLPTVTVSVRLENEGFPYPRAVRGSPFTPRVRLPLGTFEAAKAIDTSKPVPRAAAPAPVAALTPSHIASLANADGATPAHASPAIAATLNVLRAARGFTSPGFASPMHPRVASLAGTPMRQPSYNSPQSPAEDVLAARERALAQEAARVEAEKEALAEQRARLQQEMNRYAASPAPSNPPTRSPATGRSLPRSPAQRPARGFLQQPPTGRPSPGAGLAGPRAAEAPRPPEPQPAAPVPSPAPPAPTPQPAKAKALTFPASAPADLRDPSVTALFDKYNRSLYNLFQHYADEQGLRQANFVLLAQDFDLSPTFLLKKELRGIYSAVAKDRGYDRASAAYVDYIGFLEALGRMALKALAKAQFGELYPTAHSRVVVLLEMWCVADPRKLAEIKDKAAAGPDAADSAGGGRVA